MNILILSVGTRNKIITGFKNALDGRGLVVAADMSPTAPALYDADRHYLVPRISAPDYLTKVLEICRIEKIDGVLSLIDPELSLLAAHKDVFAERGVTVIGSSYDLCELALDKMAMYAFLLSHGFPCARSYTDAEHFFADVDAGMIHYPVFVKPVKGSASLSISVANDRETVEFLMKKQDGLMIQEYLHGEEIGADVYIDACSGAPVSIFTKRKLVMRAGETDKAVSFKDPALFDLLERFVKACGFRYQIDIDVFKVDGTYYISEVNPRFGGGYPHAYLCGCDHMAMILNNLMGIENQKSIGCYEEGVYMMKYSEIMLKKL